MHDKSQNDISPFTFIISGIAMKKFTGRAWLGLALMSAAGLAQAEGNISIAQQFGIGYLLLDVVRDQQLIEKEGKKEGLDIKVE
ncbi:ABC transporter substrate-binding protein, partial [Cronobacter sakazakii]